METMTKDYGCIDTYFIFYFIFASLSLCLFYKCINRSKYIISIISMFLMFFYLSLFLG